MNNAQLELSLDRNNATAILRARRAHAAKRSYWWFERMRQAVDRAFDWQPAPPARPEQTWFPGAHRQIRLSS